MRPDWDKRRADYGFCEAGLDCPSGDQQKYYNIVFPRYTTPSNDAVLDILNNVQCVYTDAAGAAPHPARAVDALDARQARQLHRRQAARPLCAGLQPAGQLRPDGLPHQQHIGAPTARGRVPLRSTGFNLAEDVPTGTPEIDDMPRTSSATPTTSTSC